MHQRPFEWHQRRDDVRRVEVVLDPKTLRNVITLRRTTMQFLRTRQGPDVAVMESPVLLEADTRCAGAYQDARPAPRCEGGRLGPRPVAVLACRWTLSGRARDGSSDAYPCGVIVPRY